ncbi:MAG TPA: protein kinase [Candidatus Limnocylindrales bacterium]|nr:protein kinase [Candidatus Limnocylindrales bacterium]
MGWTSRLVGGRYRVGRLLGQGGMSTVHEAYDEHLRRNVALKVLRAQFTADPEFLVRFDHEARAAASLSHPNIVAIHDSGRDEELRFIVMDLVDGPSLAEVLADQGRLAPERAVAIAAQVAEGLSAAHRRGIVHRDVKPGNILIDRRGRAMVGDFGIARAFGSTALTSTGTILGSLPYLSPEQATGGEATAASDIYALGTVLFEMLTGRRPFEASTASALAIRRVHEDPPEPSAVEPSLPPGLDAIVLRALARDPDARYPSARMLAQALDAWQRRWRHVREATAPRRFEPVPPPDPADDVPTVASPDGEATTRAMSASQVAGIGGMGGMGEMAHSPAGGDVAPRAADRLGRRRLRRGVALPVAWLALAVSAILVLSSVAVLATTKAAPTVTPDANVAVGVRAATPSPAPSVAVVAPSVASTPAATATPPPTPAPTVRRTARPPTPAPATPTPAPATPSTTPARPRSTPAPPVEASPAGRVIAFYAAVARHEFGRAASYWSAAMRRRYPPGAYIDGRFSRTIRFDIRRASTTSQSGNRANVSVDIVELRTSAPTREHWVGSWHLVRVDGTWLLDDPDLTPG